MRLHQERERERETGTAAYIWDFQCQINNMIPRAPHTEFDIYTVLFSLAELLLPVLRVLQVSVHMHDGVCCTAVKRHLTDSCHGDSKTK